MPSCLIQSHLIVVLSLQCSMPRSLWLGCSSLADSMPSLRCLYNPGTGALPAFQVLSVSSHSSVSLHLCTCAAPLPACFTSIYSAPCCMPLLCHSQLWYLNPSCVDSGQFSAGAFPLPRCNIITLSKLAWYHHLFHWLSVVSKIHYLIMFGKQYPAHSLQSGYSCSDSPPI